MTKEVSNDQLHAMRHSLAHIMAAAIKKLWPQAKFGVGPVIEHGFYYDVDLGDYSLTPEDLPKIEKEMQKLIKADLPLEQFDLDIDDAIAREKQANQDYKVELLQDLKTKGSTAVKDLDEGTVDAKSQGAVSYYRLGDLDDLCRGPHVASTGAVGAFRLHKLAGAYWRGDETRPMLQRVYGLAFGSQTEVDDHFKNLAEAEKRDHRKLGVELGLFTFSELVGSGLPLFTPKGTVLRELLSGYSQQLRRQRGYQAVSIPHITKPDLYKTSGHWDKFGDELFLVQSQETSDDFVLKPMNCPHHTQIYAAEPRSYRDLPVKYMETTMMYRDEKSGELHGLSRVRSISIDDTHVFARKDQIESVVSELIQAAQEMYQELQMELKFRLSFRDDSDAYLGDTELWSQAQGALSKIVKDSDLDHYIEEGEAAFYGPKLDFVTIDVLGREWQVATVQLDFIQPQRFGLEYVDERGERQTPVMVHAALLGSIERFLSVYIEHTAGRFPFWLAPEQVRILSVNDEVGSYIKQIAAKLSEVVLDKPLKYNEVRFTTDTRNESLGKKIREAEKAKIPVIMVVGPKDEAAGEVSLRTDDGESKIKLDSLPEFLTSR